jgi:phosphoglycerate-specific signal transduction histidine kinase
MKASAEKLRTEVKDKDRWKEVEASLKKAGEELERAAKAAFTKRNDS